MPPPPPPPPPQPADHEGDEATGQNDTDAEHVDDDDPQLDAKPESAFEHIPKQVRVQVRRAHRSLGHCGRQALCRLIRLAGLSEQHLEYAKGWRCEVCERRAAPGKTRVASSFKRPEWFGATVGIDTQEILDAHGEKFACLSVTDRATKFSQLILLEDRSSAGAARAFSQSWVAWAGIPDRLLADQ